MSFFCLCFICAIHYVSPSLLLRVSSVGAIQRVFLLFFQHLKFVQNFPNIPSLPIIVPFVLSLHAVCQCCLLHPVRIQFNFCVSN